MSVRAHVVVAARGIDVEIDIPDGQTVALLGANGSGKSTVLGAIAGLVTPDRGHIAVGDRTLFATAPRADVPPHRRGVALLAQQPLLFPHLTARENVAFAPRSRGARRAAATAVAEARLAEVGGLSWADARPHELSGGQAQRVAVARALAADPQLLLLDEPLTALDVGARDELRGVLATALGAVPGILVTHDPVDALLLADRAIVLADGRVVDDASVHDLLERPRSDFAARLAGVALVAGIIAGDGVAAPDGRVIPGDVGALRDGAAVFAAVPADAVTILPDPRGADLVEHVALAAGALRVTAGGLTGRIADEHDARAFAPGTRVRVQVDPQRVRIYPRVRPHAEASPASPTSRGPRGPRGGAPDVS